MPEENSHLKKVFFASIIILAILFIGTIGYLLGKKSPAVSPKMQAFRAAISGTIDFHGVAPLGSTISIGQKGLSDLNYTIVEEGITPTDGATWSFNYAKGGEAYSIKAYLKSLDGIIIAESKEQIFAAPADSEVLEISSKTTPPQNQQVQTQTKAAISGQFNLNGYIPQSSTVTISARKNGDSQFNPVSSGISAVDGAVWSFSDAISGGTYEIQAYLILNGNTVSQSEIQTITAPAYNESITINSTAKAPAAAPARTSISGTINFNGLVSQNSSISISQRQNGTSQFNTIISGIQVADGTTWNWNQAVTGTTYDIQANLIVNGAVVATSQILTVAAPAVNEVLTLNGQSQPNSPPQGSITNSCVNQSNGLWQVKFTYNNNSVIPYAQQFLLTVGNGSGQSQYANITSNPANPNNPGSQTYTTGFVFNTGQTYYAQWSYSTCASCNVFSNPSPSLSFYCNNPPPATPTSIPTSTPTDAPTATPLPTSTPMPTLLPTPTSLPTPTDTPTSTPTVPPAPTN